MASGRLRRKWFRNSLTVLAIAVSFSMLLSLSSISLGLHRASEERLDESPRDILVSSIGLNPDIENSHYAAKELAKDKNISAVMPLLTVLGRLAFDAVGDREYQVGDTIGNNKRVQVRTVGMVGVVPDLARDFMGGGNELFIRSDLLRFNGWFSDGGDPFHDSGYMENWTSELLLDENLMDEYGMSIGDIVYQLNGSGKVSAVYRIVGGVETSLVGSGLASKLVGGIGMVHLGELQWASGYHRISTPEGERVDLSNVIYIDLHDVAGDEDSRDPMILMLESRFPGLDVTTKESRLYRIEEEVLVLEVFAVSVAAASIFIGVLFLSSIMIIDVEDRRSDISIMRAIGISRRTIFIQTIRDSVILSILGALLGLIPGWLGSNLLDTFLKGLYGLNITFSRFEPLVLLGSLLYLFLVASVFSMVPAVRATTIMPKAGFDHIRNR